MLKNISISKKLALLAAVFIAGYGAFAVFSFRALNMLRIQGNLYNQIIMSKDLIADILPPPEYIIESYINVLQMADERDDALLENHIAILQRLRNEYNERHQFWVNEVLLEHGDMRTFMLENSYNPAIEFYDITFNEFIPALKRGDYELAKSIVLNDLRAKYQEHRNNIDRVVELATQNYENIENTAAQSIKKNIALLSITALAVIVFALLISISISFSITKPLGNTIVMLENLAEGEGDLTKRLLLNSKDELGRMARYFNATLDKIKSLIETIRNEALALSGIGGELSNNMARTGTEIAEISQRIQNIKERGINQSASVTQTNATMVQITENIEKLNKSVEKQNQSVAQSSSAIEEMLANIKSVTDTLSKNSENVSLLTDAAGVGRNGIAEVASDIAEISKESEGLLEINAVMQNIAAQTNLLSMNAAIEAAHAGEAGKGFAVVADEIRKLAENSSEQSKTIANVLKKIHSSIEKITRGADAVLAKFEAIDAGVKTVAEQEEHILRAMEEQGEGSKQILESVSLLNELSLEVRDGALEMQEGSREVIRESRNLETATSEITAGMNEMSRGAETINGSVNEVKTMTGRNKESIEILVGAVSKFKVE